MTTSLNSVAVYSILDKTAEQYGPPFVAKNDNVALRMYNRLIEEERAVITDYELYRIAFFDNVSGSIGAVDPVKIHNLDRCVEKIKGTFGENTKEVK